MQKDLLDDIRMFRDLCSRSKSFGTVLSEILDDNDIPQKKLAESLNYSISHVNRIINDQIPDNLHLEEVRHIVDVISCSETDWAKLALAFTCYFLSKKGLLDL